MSSGFEVVPSGASTPRWYPELLNAVVDQVESGRFRAAASANHEMVATYWAIGKELLRRESDEGWGAKVVTRLSADLRDRFPEVRGFSPRNLRYMKSLAAAWPDLAMLQTASATLPWSHHVLLLDKISDESARLWYARQAASEGWSRNVLAVQIESRLHERAGKATSNFHTTLPPSSSVLAQEAMKDPYVFDFLDMTATSNERDLERQLIDHVERFLLELGRGFAFVGRQMRLDVGGDEFFPDLLFYNFRLRRFVVIELKAGKFEPGHLGQLGMYMSAVDDLLAHPDDEPTIGLLLCKTKNAVVAEYALRGYHSPIGVAEWATELETSMPADLAPGLPTIDELEAELAEAPDPGKEPHP
jgi:predicted nuclease of restriction endonuclease-like (RecB) superfamily